MFKIGDRVRVIEPNNRVGEFKGLPKGTIAEIVAGKTDMWEIDKGGQFWIWRDDQIELIGNESPIRTVTRREIVPGTYGKIFINDYNESANTVSLNVKDDFGCVYFNAEELREAAHLFSQLAEALEDKS